MIFSAIFRAPNYAKCGIWQAYLGEPNMAQRGISNSCRWFWQQLFLGRTWALSESRKMTTFSRRSVELGYVKLYPNSILRVSSKQFWQPQAWPVPFSKLSTGGVQQDVEKTNNYVIRPCDPFYAGYGPVMMMMTMISMMTMFTTRRTSVSSRLSAAKTWQSAPLL